MNTQRYIATTLWMLTSATAQTPPGCQAPSPIDLGGYSPFAGVTAARPESVADYFSDGLTPAFPLPLQMLVPPAPIGNASSRWVAGDLEKCDFNDRFSSSSSAIPR